MMTTKARPVNGQTATLADYEHVTSRLQGFLPSPGGMKAMARCPAHEDNRRSLSLGIGDDGRLLVNCLAGCPPEDVARAVGVEMKDLFPRRNGDDKPSRKSGRKPKGNIVATYDYRSATGELLYQVCRMEPKDFRQRRPDPSARDGWAWNLNGVRRALYRLPELLAADPQATVFVVEGEKDADRLASLSPPLVATTNAGGAGRRKWLDAYSESLRGRAVVILPDNDDVGREHGEAVARALHGVAASVRVIELPNLPDKGDVSDWLNAGGTRERLEEMAAAAPLWTPPEKPTEGDRVPVEITTDEARVTDEVIEALRRDSDLYVFGGRLVIVTRGDVPRIVQLSLAGLRDRIARQVEFFRVVKSEDGDREKPEHVPRWCVESVDSRREHPGIRPMEGVATHPILRPDGTILAAPGYDPVTRLVYRPCGEFPEAPATPTAAEVRESLSRLLYVLVDFPFGTDAHRSAALALLLTLVGRHSFDGPAPLFAIDATTRGTGKSLMADTCAVIATGRTAARMTYPRDDDETRKRITSIALQGDPFALMDNVAGPIGSPSLDAALTATRWKDRRLGNNETIDLPLRTVWACTGNNLQFGADTARRVAHIRLVSPLENPEERDDVREPDLLGFVRRHRPRLLVDCLTLLRAWFVAGCPRRPLKPWGSFDSFSDVIRQCIVWLGLADPGDTRSEVREKSDSEAMGLRLLVESWGEMDERNEGVSSAEIARRLELFDQQYPRFRAAILDLVPGPPGKTPGARQIGNRLKHLQGRVVGGKHIGMRLDRKGLALWYVTTADSALSADSVPPHYASENRSAHTHNAHVEASGDRPARESAESAESAPDP